MIKKCRGCGRDIKWSINLAGKLEPLDLDTGGSHFATCPVADMFKPQEPGEKYDPMRSIWFELNYDEQIALQRQELSKMPDTVAVMNCRNAQRDPHHLDRWCRACFQPRPDGYPCEVSRPSEVSYAVMGGEVIRFILKTESTVLVNEKVGYKRLTGTKAREFLSQVRGLQSSSQSVL